MSKQKRPTIRQVAEAAGVSPTTVSFILNGRRSDVDRISADTQQRVLTAISELGYFPDQSARNLRRRSTSRICLAVNNLGIPYNSILAKELYKAASDLGYMTIIALMGSEENERKTLDQLMSGLADGVIFISPSFLSESEFARLAQIGYAVVVSSNHLRPNGVDVVQNTEEEATHTALNYLYRKGHRRIGYLGAFTLGGPPYPRYVAYRRFMTENGLPLNDDWVKHDPGVSREEAFYTARTMLSLPEAPSALFCGSDLAAVSTIYAANEKGLRVPADLAVIGSGNIPEGKIIQPALTTIGPEKFDFSSLINFLITRLRKEAPPEGRLHRIVWDLVLRESA